jgi:hypothetical protein
MKSNDNQEVRGRVTKNAEMPDYMRKPPQQDKKKSNIRVASITSLRRKSNREREGSSGGQGDSPPTGKGEIEHSERGKHTNTKAPAADSFRGPREKPTTTGRSSNKATQRSGIRREEDEDYQETARERARRKNRAAAA